MSAIAVLVAERPHSISGKPTRSRSDAVAASVALAIPQHQVSLWTAGAIADSVARDYLALGANTLHAVECAAPEYTVAALCGPLKTTPWVLTGTRSEAEQGSNLLPYALAHALDRPLVVDVVAIAPEPQGDGSHWVVTQALPKGARRTLRVAAPAVLAISASAPVTLRHALASAMAGQVVRHAHSANTQGQASSASDTPVQQVPRNKRRKVLEARIAQSGHARMLGAIESPASAGTVLKAGTPNEKAQAVLDYLRTHSLVNF